MLAHANFILLTNKPLVIGQIQLSKTRPNILQDRGLSKKTKHHKGPFLCCRS